MRTTNHAHAGELDSRASRQTAVLVNVAKIALLAALAPPVIAGIAERATRIAGPGEAASIVAMTVSAGAGAAVLGALILGIACDAGTQSHRTRWLWVAVGAAVGTAGLLTAAAGDTTPALLGGWTLAQLGYSGAMAVLRTVLVSVERTHRRRGAVVVVVAAYGGLAIPLLLLIALPGRAWAVTLGLAAAALLIPLAVLVLFPPARRGSPLATAPEPPRTHDRGSAAPPVPAPGPSSFLRSGLSPIRVLALQFLSGSVIAALVAYHPLDLHARAGSGDFPVSASSWAAIAAILGLVAATGVLYRRPEALGSPRLIVALAGVLLAASLVLRTLSPSPAWIAAAAALSGTAVGLNNSALLSAALETAPERRHGSYIGAFSAAGALGQVAGPLAGLAVVRAATHGAALDGGYSALFLVLAAVAALCSAAAVIPDPRPRPGRRATALARPAGALRAGPEDPAP